MTKAQRRREQKKQERRELIVGAIVLVLFFLLVGRVGYWETHYNRDAQVISVSGDLVTVRDKAGFTWEFYGDDFHKGENVRLLMFTNGTDSIVRDDEIIDVKKR